MATRHLLPTFEAPPPADMLSRILTHTLTLKEETQRSKHSIIMEGNQKTLPDSKWVGGGLDSHSDAAR